MKIKVILCMLVLFSIIPSISLSMEASQQLSGGEQKEQCCDNCWSSFIAAFQYDYLKQLFSQGSTTPYLVASITTDINNRSEEENQDFCSDFFTSLFSAIAYGHMAQMYPPRSNTPYLAASTASGINKALKKASKKEKEN